MTTNKHMVLMCHTVFGYPTLSQSLELMQSMIDSDVEIIEIQLPFSDPIADGPEIMFANNIAIKNGASIETCLKAIKRLNLHSAKIVLMSYFQPVFVHGVDSFVREAAQSGVSGLIVPDLPPEEDIIEGLRESCKKHGIGFIPVLSPNISPQRLKLNLTMANDFVYCTSRTGITGQMTSLNGELNVFVREVRKITNVPIAVGFGIKTPKDIQSLICLADIAVVGTAITRAITKDGVEGAIKLVNRLVAVTKVR